MTASLTRLSTASGSLARVACLVLAAMFTVLSSAEAGRSSLTLEDGVTVVVVDNYSAYPDAHARNLVIGADRSTQDDGMFHRPRKGLFAAGNRILVRTRYVAWFHTGILLGHWSLNLATGLFAYPRTGPNGFTDWSHNELLRGSASPQGQVWFWDTGSPGPDGYMVFQLPTGNGIITHHGGYFAPNGSWSTIYDGTVVNGEVYYATASRMAGSIGTGPLQVDVSDGNDANGIQNYVESQLGFVCGENDIRVVWRFRPSALPVAPSLTAYSIWAHYSFDTDGSYDPVRAIYCDSNLASNNSPDQTWGEPGYFMSNRQTSFGWPNTETPGNTIAPLVRGVACQSGQIGPVRYLFGPSHGDWVRWGEHSSLAAGTPRWTLTTVDDASWGTPIAWSNIVMINDVTDGVWGAGAGVYNATFSAGTWYVASYRLSAQ